MTSDHSRRNFLKLSAIAGGLAPCMGMLVAANEADKEKDPCEEKIKNAVNRREANEVHERINLTKRLVKKFGKGIIDEIKQYTIDETREWFQKKKIAKRDLDAVKKNLWDHLDNDRFQFVKVKETPEYLEYKVTRCILAELAKKFDGQEIGSAFYCAYDYGYCQGINPKIQFSRTKTLMNGDDCCNHTYRLPKE